MPKIYPNKANDILLAEGRANYVYLEEPHEDDQGRVKYKLTHAMPESTFKRQKKYIDAAIKEAAKIGVEKKHFNMAAFTEALKGKGSLHLPVVFANEKMRLGEWKEQDALKDMVCFSAWNKTRPHIRKIEDGQKIPIDDWDEIYSGMWILSLVSFFPFGQGRPMKGIGVYLNAVLKVRDGEPLSGGPTAEEAFAEIELEEEEVADLE